MGKNLVLVESPSKAKTINKYLGKDYTVEASVGHIRDLPKTKLGVDIEDEFKPQLLNIRGKGDLIKKIKLLASKSKNIFIATDPDREGEAIAQDLADIISGGTQAKVFRVLFNEITKNSVLKSIATPTQIDSNLVVSQRARRVLDRIIGYQISPILWKKVIESSYNNLSAGRVQSVALRLICEREAEIESFIATEYWSLWAEFKTDKNETFKAKLIEVNGKQLKIKPKPIMTEEDYKEFLVKNFALDNAKDAKALLEKILLCKEFVISQITKKEGRRNPPPPFITSSMQAEASRKLGFRPRQTMQIAQNLYEGIDLGEEGTVGLISYMRTDSTRISEEFIQAAREFIEDKQGKKYLSETARHFEKKNSNVQDAHEAIRPTSLKYTPEFVKKHLDSKQFKLYQLIWKRFIASQMASAIIDTTVVDVKANGYVFRANGSVIEFDGFLSLYDEQSEDSASKEEGDEEIIPSGLKQDQTVNLTSLNDAQHFTKPPARFSESSLIKELESNGIGRPSTYASIVGTIQERKYVVTIEKRLQPTELGKKVSLFLTESFPDILNVNFTAQMEEDLDLIAQGQKDYISVMRDFYDPFSKALNAVEAGVEKIVCEKCGGEMLMKIGRFGRFLACSNYPECSNIKSLKEYQQEQKEPEYTGETCEKCGARTVYRYGKFGKFIGCEKYPECDYIKNVTTGIKCPKCKDGEIAERKSKRGKVFFGCTKYPDCDFVAWYRPVETPCPKGDSPYMEARYSQKKGKYLKCPTCGEEMIVETQE